MYLGLRRSLHARSLAQTQRTEGILNVQEGHRVSLKWKEEDQNQSAEQLGSLRANSRVGGSGLCTHPAWPDIPLRPERAEKYITQIEQFVQAKRRFTQSWRVKLR